MASELRQLMNGTMPEKMIDDIMDYKKEHFSNLKASDQEKHEEVFRKAVNRHIHRGIDHGPPESGEEEMLYRYIQDVTDASSIQAADTVSAKVGLQEQPLGFMGLPTEIRFMIYGMLRDNQKDFKYSNPAGYTIEQVYLRDMFYPSLLSTNKQINAEYSSVAFEIACINVHYQIDKIDEDPPPLPLISDFVTVSKEVLAKIPILFFTFELDFELPEIDPFESLPDLVEEFPALKAFYVLSDVNHTLLNFTNGPELFGELVENMHMVDNCLCSLLDDWEREYIFTKLGCRLVCPLYEPLPRMLSSFDLPLKQGRRPAPDLPRWGYVVFEALEPWECPDEDAFEYHGVDVKFQGVEYDFPAYHPLDSESMFGSLTGEWGDDSVMDAQGPWSNIW